MIEMSDTLKRMNRRDRRRAFLKSLGYAARSVLAATTLLVVGLTCLGILIGYLIAVAEWTGKMLG